MATPSSEETKTAEEIAADKVVADAATAAAKADADELAAKDTSKFTDEQKNDYIEKLKDENAKRRIKANKLKELQERKDKEVADAKIELDEAKKKIDEYDKKKKEADDKEKSEVERLSSRVKELESSLSVSDQELVKTKGDLTVKDLEITKQSRETLVEKLVRQLSFEFTSEYERDGFMSAITVVDPQTNEFELNDEEIIIKVKEFVKTAKLPPKTPGPGPVNRQQDTPLTEEIKALLIKKTLDDKDQLRLDELLEAVG